MDYWALGHLHKHQNFTGSASTIADSGNTQGRSMKPAERGEKGALVVQVGGGKVMDTEFVALDHARFMTLTLDVSGQTDLGALRACLSKKGSDLRQANPGRGLVVRVYLQGRGPVHRDLVRRGAVEDLLSCLLYTSPSPRDGLL